jgi:cardiolipin synthase
MKKQEELSKYQHRILTIPNILSFVRLCMIPLFIWIYCVRKNYALTGVVILLSGMTDLADGFIARHFHMISDLGKVLDPVADKLTQAAVLFCLVTRFPFMLVPLILMVFKECYMAVAGAMAIKKTGKVVGAQWHGKMVTALLYAMMIVHVFWYDIPMVASNVMIIACVAMMLVSVALYGRYYGKILRKAKER